MTWTNATDECHRMFPFSNDWSLYQWSRGTLMLSRSMRVERPKSMFRRPSIRLLVATKKSFSIQFHDGSQYEARAMVIASPSLHKYLDATDSGLALFDFAIATPEYLALRAVFGDKSVTPLDIGFFGSLLPMIERGLEAPLRDDEVRKMVGEVVELIGSKDCNADNALDPRIIAILDLIERSSLEDISLPQLAQRVSLSPGRLRHLFQQQVGCPLSHYTLTSAVWRARKGLTQQKRLTEIAHEAGFYDLAHFSRSYTNMYGYCPSSIAAHGQLKFLADESW